MGRQRSTRRPPAVFPPALSQPPNLAGSRVMVFGLGRAGVAVSRFLLRVGARVFGWDDDEPVRQSAVVRKLERAGLEIAGHPASVQVDFVVVSPGIASSHPLLRLFRHKRLPIVDELDLASRFLPGSLICVTGTNGKSTTTALIAEILRSAGKSVFCGGNIAPGRPLSAALGLPGRDWYVVEVSSFQLERARWLAPRVALILNITSDHLDRHGSLQRYAECKLRILDRQRAGDIAVLGWDDPIVRAARGRGSAQKLYFSARRRVRGAYLEGGQLWFNGERIMPARGLRLRGAHNLLNALAALCAVKTVGTGNVPVRHVLESFGGLPHRLESVRVLRGVEYVNNSMCTNPAAGVRSLEAFNRRVVIIAGGREKGLLLDPFVDAIVRRAGWAVLIGESREKMAEELRARGFNRFDLAYKLRDAVRVAQLRARRGDVVLFSPGFASFDMFKDFADRGRKFKHAVYQLR